jgi:hypothetical protein
MTLARIPICHDVHALVNEASLYLLKKVVRSMMFTIGSIEIQ